LDNYDDYDYDRCCCSSTTGDDKRDNGGKENGMVKRDEDDVDPSGPSPPTSDNLRMTNGTTRGIWPLRKGTEEDKKERVG
jgi:hypothetical protein